MTETVRLERQGAVARITLARPAAANALDDGLIDQLNDALALVAGDEAVRAVILDGEGESFCAGTDVGWMEMAAKSRKADDLYRLGALLEALRGLPKPVVARVHGPAIGAGVALAACADVVLASDDAFFQLPAVRLGIVPAVIGPFVIEAIGLRQARRYLLSGETFGADKALALGLVHEVCRSDGLDRMVRTMTDNFVAGGPLAIHETKTLLATRGHDAPSPALMREAARRSTAVRRSPEGREGLAATLERRPPNWR